MCLKFEMIEPHGEIQRKTTDRRKKSTGELMRVFDSHNLLKLLQQPKFICVWHYVFFFC